VAVGSELPRLDGYPFEVRFSDGALVRATVAAELVADAYVYFSHLFSAVEPDIAVVSLATLELDAEPGVQAGASLVGELDGAVLRCAAHPVEFEEARGHGGAERPSEVVALLGPVQAVADQRPPTRGQSVEIETELGEQAAARIGEAILNIVPRGG
jgi:hypothetical protein